MKKLESLKGTVLTLDQMGLIVGGECCNETGAGGANWGGKSYSWGSDFEYYDDNDNFEQGTYYDCDYCGQYQGDGSSHTRTGGGKS